MVSVYVKGERVGVLADLEQLLPQMTAGTVEFRDVAGNAIGTFLPKRTPTPGEPLVPWDPSITQAELDRRAAEPGLTFEEVKKRLGWE